MKAWERNIAPLAKARRRSDAPGAHEVGVAAGADGVPSPAQDETYRRFLDREEATCRNVCDALLRYDRSMRSRFPDGFRGEAYPDGRSVEDLGPWIAFDGIDILREESHGTCPVVLSWNPAWDQEHKLEMVLYKDQVLEIGSACAGSMLLLSPQDYLTAPDLAWGADDLNAAEREALREFLDGYGLDPRDGA